jgi:HK97 family phage prohead protease
MSRKLELKSDPAGRQTRSFALSIKAAGDDGTVEGYGSVFGVRDSYDDVIAAGAFKSSLAAHKAVGTMPAMLWQHNPSEPIGAWSEMVEDEKGLLIRGKLALDTVRGKEAHALMKMGAINGLSIGFYSKEWQYDRETDVRTLTALDLWEVSICTFPANSKARVTQVKAADDIALPKDAERILRDAGFGKVDACGFVSRVMRLGEERRDAAMVVERSERAAAELLRKITESASR